MFGLRVPVVLALCAAFLSAGCFSSPELYTFQTGSVNPSDVHDTFEVSSGKAGVAFQVGGAGSVSVKISDADGDQVFSRSFSGSGGDQSGKELTGAAGEWTIDIDFGQWSGGFQLVVTGA